MQLPTITNSVASNAWNSRKNSSVPTYYDGDVLYVGEGPRLTALDLLDVIDALKSIRRRVGEDTAGKGGEIDQLIVEPIHHEISKLSSEFYLSQIGFWRWLSVEAADGVFWDFIDWRFQFKSDKLINWGVVSQKSAVEAYFYRAWLRGQTMYDKSLDDPYRYARIGGSDIWRSHIFRVEHARDPKFVRALLDTVHDPDGKVVVSSERLRDHLIPKIRAWTSNASFAHLDYDECKTLLGEFLASST